MTRLSQVDQLKGAYRQASMCRLNAGDLRPKCTYCPKNFASEAALRLHLKFCEVRKKKLGLP